MPKLLLLLATLLSLVSAFLPHSPTTRQSFSSTRSSVSVAASTSTASTTTSSETLQGLKVAIVGGGPSGLLLAHKLVQSGASVHLVESRSKPVVGATSAQGKAYALGVGRRGRTAIQSAGSAVWKAVQDVGFASERFRLHVGPLALKLRDSDGKQEPSLLLFQSDLCAALLNALVDDENSKTDKLKVQFDTKVTNIDLSQKTFQTKEGATTESFDLIVGCDGVNSIVRTSIAELWPEFETTRETLKGQFKAIQLATMPPKLDPTAVALLLPKSGSTTAFVEPTGNGGCCVLFAGSNTTDPLLVSGNADEILQALQDRYPLLEGSDLQSVAEQLAATPKASQASSVKCNTYHCGHAAVLCGDAAHATGGVSGQGVNSALVDSVALADALCANYPSGGSDKLHSLQRALLDYSQKQVPEGHALFDLSFPPPPESAVDKLLQTFRTARDFVIRGRFGIGSQPIQTILTTSLQSFSDIRQNRQKYYGNQVFPDEATWRSELAALDAKAPTRTSDQSKSSASTRS